MAIRSLSISYADRLLAYHTVSLVGALSFIVAVRPSIDSSYTSSTSACGSAGHSCIQRAVNAAPHNILNKSTSCLVCQAYFKYRNFEWLPLHHSCCCRFFPAFCQLNSPSTREQTTSAARLTYRPQSVSPLC